MMGFMMWMAGSTVHLFSIGITFLALLQPLTALQGVGKVFAPYKDNKVDLIAPKLLYIALNVVCLGVGVWKLNTLGLLPTHASVLYHLLRFKLCPLSVLRRRYLAKMKSVKSEYRQHSRNLKEESVANSEKLFSEMKHHFLRFKKDVYMENMEQSQKLAELLEPKVINASFHPNFTRTHYWQNHCSG